MDPTSEKRVLTSIRIQRGGFNEFHGFSEKLFELTSDPRFCLLTPSHGSVITSIIAGIKKRRGFISVTGEVGTGKTTLIGFLLKKEALKMIDLF
jgi:type II secretory pathway predicted ATPase ExeA